MPNQSFERNGYAPPRDVTAEEAERNKRQQSVQDAAIRDPDTAKGDAPPAKSDKATG
ncbi:hypothetical protein [Paracoccus luteus]|uniref:hypothetical protein n=1 Tax=Paracoccus luteus TaxID=2508543 RepID=UPI00142FDC7D|nr:hypothetical protein [Paracoccus luteus]